MEGGEEKISVVTLAFDRKIHVTRTGIIVGTCVNIQSSAVSPLAPVNTLMRLKNAISIQQLRQTHPRKKKYKYKSPRAKGKYYYCAW